MDENDRTTALGLFNYAHSYWSSAVALEQAKLGTTHPDAPINYLYFHAMELYLKSYLRSQGLSVAELRKIGHRIEKLAETAEAKGLHLFDEDKTVFSMIPPNYMAARYIVVGSFSRPRFEALWGTCNSLHDVIADELTKLQLTKRIMEAPRLSDEEWR